jgi:hypothetical protein
MSRTVLTTAALTCGLVAGGLALGAVPSLADSTDRGSGAAVAKLRKSIAKYADPAAARADGFVPAGDCVSSPPGGMGIHFVNPGRMQAPLDPNRPQILLYEPAPDGTLALAGAEFFVPDADQDLRTDGDRPTLFDQPFDGPMPGHEPGMPVHYDLHVWTHEANPGGTFAPWNRRVTCP